MRKARVFISCGQLNDRERDIGKCVQDYFEERGFDTYFAERVHSSEALTANIFNHLKQSEYFVFIDFKRISIKENDYRGSLFVNQEIAISTFLKIKGIGFIEKGVKQEGVLRYHIYNAFDFEDGTEIIHTLKEQTRDWDVNSYNELEISYNANHVSKGIPRTDGTTRNWYHLTIKNRNKYEHAHNCVCYVTRIKDLQRHVEFKLPTIELTWVGLRDPSANIIRYSERDMNAFFVICNRDDIHFDTIPSDAYEDRYNLPVLTAGKYLLEYSVISANFCTLSKEYMLEFSKWDNIILEPVVSNSLSAVPKMVD